MILYNTQKPLTIIKIGTTTLTSPEGHLDLNNLRQLVYQMCQELSRGMRHLLVVTSGAITCGAAALALTAETIPEKQAAASVGQTLLMQEYRTFFGEKGISVGQILLTKDCTEDPIKKTHTQNTIFTLLAYDAVPIINENDSVATDEIGIKFGDNDELSCSVAQLVKAKDMIILSDTDGFYSANPKTHPEAQLIPELDIRSDHWLEMIEDIPNSKSRGGMTSKLTHAMVAVKAGTQVVIANGRRPHVLRDIFSGQAVGTRIF